MTLTSQSTSGFDYKCSFAGQPSIDLSVTDIAQLTWACETLECYGIVQGSDYPDTLMTAMTGIEIKVGSAEADISWSTENLVTDTVKTASSSAMPRLAARYICNETGDTSVTPLNSAQEQNYNFAIARVRLQGAGGVTSTDLFS